MGSKNKINYNMVTSKIFNHVSTNTVFEFEKEILQHTNWKEKNAFPSKLITLLTQYLDIRPFLKKIHVNKLYFSIIMHINDFNYRTFPYFHLSTANKILYLFDTWEPIHDEILNTLERNKVDIVFVTARQSCELLQEKSDKIQFFWIPEGISISNYKYHPYEKKNIDLLQIGRKYDWYHDQIVGFCRENQITYYYEKKKGDLVFPICSDFIEGLARTKISICTPSCLTNPERSGSISTVTQRYLQSMVSKCLVVGIAPDEMDYLFDYEPIIPIDENNPVGQIKDILKNYDDFIPLIEKNYKEVKKKHQWVNRVEQIQRIISTS